MKPSRLLLAACAALQPLVLGGCVAAVVPVVAGGMLAKKRLDRKPPPPREAPAGVAAAREGEVIVGPPGETAAAVLSPRQQRREARRAARRERLAAKTGPAETGGAPLPGRLRPIAAGDIPAATGAPVVLTGLTALPAPGGAPGAVGAPFPAFARYAIAAAAPQPGQSPRSALTDPATLTAVPARQPCGQQPPAVVIDLDPGKAAFDLDNPPAAAPGLAEQLAALRAAGITILWAASLPVDKSERLYATLAATGLDTDRTDRLLLLRKPGERKQARRRDAARDWCIVAIAGDSKADFEEAYDYLRDPNGAIAQALSANLGEGWFLVPQPIS